MMTNNNFSKILNNYFSKHLSLERKFSVNTYETYLIVLKQFIEYLKKEKGLSPKDITISSFDKETIIDFLRYVENDLGCSIKTRNHKLTVINSFLDYAQSIDPTCLDIYLGAKSIRLKKTVKEKMDYLTKEELEIFMKQINIKTKNGYKHYIIVALMYEAGLRASELTDLRIDDLFFMKDTSYIKILGKGGKERIIYLNDDIVLMIDEYRSKFNIDSGYLFLNNSGRKLTRFSLNKMIARYYDLAKKECPTLIRKTITPHSFRHSKAVHLLMNNTALLIIQRFLGHSSIKTTEIYLDITNEEVKKSISKAASHIKANRDVKASWQGNDKLIELLESLES